MNRRNLQYQSRVYPQIVFFTVENLISDDESEESFIPENELPQFTDASAIQEKKCWDNSDFEFEVMESSGRSGGLLSLWDPTLFRKSSIDSMDLIAETRTLNEAEKKDKARCKTEVAEIEFNNNLDLKQKARVKRAVMDIKIMERLQLINGKWVWIDDKNIAHDFSVKLVRTYIDERILPCELPIIPWSNWVPLKVNAFAWRASMDRIPSKDRFSGGYRSVLLPNMPYKSGVC
ncbi:hypothetical protein E3N88_41117 [Mikania micrantha]|uniref:Reverse transcriptase zinc-binding domain-containing protein n=1 Tax=Mikania micrantha TaxID=192012 RepID=A0A5N6LPH5_9ASTR|nr:hypothetical protein E3N88_41117 [Mikania micrantha]